MSAADDPLLPPERAALSLAERVDPRHAAALFIDLQHDFCSPGGAMARTGADPSPLQRVLPAAGRLLTAARALGVPVVHVRAEYNAPGAPHLSQAWLDQARRRWNGRYVEVPMCVPGSWGAEICPEARPAPGEPVVVKHRFSAFAGTELDLLLRSRRIRTLVVAGVVTYVCVESTVRDAFFADYHVVVCSDCVAGWNAEWHRVSLEVMDWGFAEVVPSPRVLEAWEEVGALRSARA
jgi:ureidoacrylate peracid hydrolase